MRRRTGVPKGGQAATVALRCLSKHGISELTYAELGGRNRPVRRPWRSDQDAFAGSGNHGVPAEVGGDLVAERGRRGRLAVHHIGDRRGEGGGGQPADDLVGVGMDREARDVHHLGADLHVPAVNLDRSGPVDQVSGPGSEGREAHHQHGRAGIGEQVGQVVQHSAAIPEADTMIEGTLGSLISRDSSAVRTS